MFEKLFTMFSYGYMVRAFIAGLIVSVLVACLGTVMVHKRLSMIGDALSHTSLAGVAIGMCLGINPVLGAVCACLIGALSIEAIRRKIGNHSELAVAVILSLGVGIAGVLSGFVKSATDFSSFLFGSVVATSVSELVTVAVIGVIVITFYIIFYRDIFLISFDEQSASMMGVKVKFINTLITILTALTVAVGARTVGTLIITSLMIVPVASAVQVAKSYKQQVILSVVFSAVSTVCGLTFSFLWGLKPGGTICLAAVIIFFACTLIKHIRKS